MSIGFGVRVGVGVLGVVEVVVWGLPPGLGSQPTLTWDDLKAIQTECPAVRIAAHLSFPWSLGALGILTPWFLRDMAYRFVAKRRYKWFGRSEACRVPTPELRERFLA